MDDQRPDFTREPAGRFDWERVFRRVLIQPPSTKLLGFVMATYADQDGGRVRPGRERLSAEMGASLSVVDRGQRSLEQLGFLDKVRKGHGAGRGKSGGFASEFQLTIPSDLLESIPMLDPDGKHSSPVTSGSGINSSLVTTGSAKPVVNLEEPLVRNSEPLVNMSKPLVTGDTPPEQEHQTNNQYMNHQGVSVTLGDAHEKNSDENGIPKIGGDPEWEQIYAAASQHLQNLSDHGQAIMEKIRAADSTASAMNRVIAAAMATGWNQPGLRDAS